MDSTQPVKNDRAPFAPRGNIVGQGWPAVRYPLDAPASEGRVFNSADDVPAGWHDGSEAGKKAARASLEAPVDEVTEDAVETVEQPEQPVQAVKSNPLKRKPLVAGA